MLGVRGGIAVVFEEMEMARGECAEGGCYVLQPGVCCSYGELGRYRSHGGALYSVGNWNA